MDVKNDDDMGKNEQKLFDSFINWLAGLLQWHIIRLSRLLSIERKSKMKISAGMLKHTEIGQRLCHMTNVSLCVYVELSILCLLCVNFSFLHVNFYLISCHQLFCLAWRAFIVPFRHTHTQRKRTCKQQI